MSTTLQLSNTEKSSIVNSSLLEQRLACRAQLAKQRQLIAFQLTPALALTHRETSARYPRSITMRLLTQNPAPALRLILALATLIIGARASSALNTGFQIFTALSARKQA